MNLKVNQSRETIIWVYGTAGDKVAYVRFWKRPMTGCIPTQNGDFSLLTFSIQIWDDEEHNHTGEMC